MKGKFFMLGRNLLSLLLKMMPSEWRQRLAIHLGVCHIRWSLMHLKRFGFGPSNVMDVGPFEGSEPAPLTRLTTESNGHRGNEEIF